MKVLKFLLGVVFFVVLVVLVQLPEPPMESPLIQYQRLPNVNPRAASEAGNSFENLAGNTIADAALFGDLAPQSDPDFSAALDRIRPMTTVFAPAEGAIALAKAA